MRRNLKLTLLFAFEALIILLLLLTGLEKPGADSRLPETKISGIMIRDEESGSYVFPDDHQETDKMEVVLSLEYGKLQKGSYRGYVNYHTSGNGKLELGFSSSLNSYLKANPLILDYRQDRAVFDITVTQPVNNFVINLSSFRNAELTADIGFSKSNAGTLRTIISVFLIFSAVEAAVVCYQHSPRHLRICVFIILTASAAFLPYLLKGIRPGNDLEYHFMRIEALANELRNGQFPVYMESMWIGDYGYPASLYYCDLFLYLPAVLRLLGFSFDASYKLFVFYINVLTALTAFVSLRKIFRKDSIAFLLGFVYTCAPYRLVDIYVRSAVGEYCALTFLPLIGAGFYGICTAEPKEGRTCAYLRPVLDLSAGMAGLFLSHMLTTEMTLLMLGLSAVILAKKVFTLRRLKAFFLAAFFTVLLCLEFLVPFLDFTLSNETEISYGMLESVPVIQDFGVQPGELFMFWKDLFGSGANNGMGDRMYLSIGLVLMLTLMAALGILVKKPRPGKLALFTGMACFSLFLSSDLFPWNSLARLSRIGVLMAQIQFPWRFLTMAVLFAVLTMGALLEIGYGYIEKQTGPMADVCRLAGKASAGFIAFLVFIEASVIFSCYSTYPDRAVVYNTNEIEVGNVEPYHILRRGTDPVRFTYDVRAEGADVWKIHKTGTSWLIFCETGETDAVVTMPLLNYKGYRVTDDSGQVFPVFDGENKEVSFQLPAHYAGTIDVSFHPLWYWFASAGMSAFCWVLFLLLRRWSQTDRCRHPYPPERMLTDKPHQE